MDSDKPKRKREPITIRIARTAEDADAVIELGRAMHAEGYYKKFPYNAEKLRRMALQSLEDGGRRYAMLMAEYKGELIGILVAAVDSLFFSDSIIATTLLFYVSPTRRGSLAAVKLLHAYKIWSKQRGADDICVHVTSGVHLKQTDKLMRKLGFMQIGGNYASHS